SASLRSKCDSDAELARTLTDDVRHCAVHTEGGDDQRDDSQEREELSAKPPRAELSVMRLLHGYDVRGVRARKGSRQREPEITQCLRRPLGSRACDHHAWLRTGANRLLCHR